MRRRARAAIVIVVVGAALAAYFFVARRPRPVPTPAPAPLAVDAELSGCAAIVAGPVCELPRDRTLRVFVHKPHADVTFENGDASVLRTLDDGTSFRVVVKEGARELRVLSRSFRLAPSTIPSWLEEARAKRAKGDVEGALALARANESSSDPVHRAYAVGLRARLELAASKPEASFPLFREAARALREAGRISDAADDRFALAFALNQRSHRYAEARAVLDEVAADVGSYPDGRARESYFRGTLATETGDARTALRLLRDARARAARLGLGPLERNAVNAYAWQLELLGRNGEALELLRDLEEAATKGGASPCEKAEIAINIGFGALLANERSPRPELDAVAPLERALALCNDACKDKYLRVATLGNLAFAALQRGDTKGARAQLEQARSGAADARASETLFWREMEGLIGLAENDPRRALTAFDDEARLAESVFSFEASWRALTGKGAALEKLGRNEDALAQYRAAEDLLGDLSFLVPLGEGRGTFLGDRGRSARYAIDLLTRMGKPEEAFSITRSSRARVVATLARTARVEAFGAAERSQWERALGSYRTARAALDSEAKDDWKLSRAEALRAKDLRKGREGELRAALDEALASSGAQKTPRLAPLPADSTTLAFHPTRTSWLAFVSDASGVTPFPLPALDPAAPREILSAELRVRIAKAARLRVLPYGWLRGVDFHALVVDDAPLGARVAIEYPMDLPVASAPNEKGDVALVVFDPSLDLRKTHAEADAVARALREHGWTVDALGGPNATSAGVLPKLGAARLFHYAGHGVFAGREAWESVLPLAAGGQLTIGDVLASKTVPTRVVLSGCETARASSESPAESLGMAQAFVIAGSAFVIAPVRPVEDALAAKMSSALYTHMAGTGAVDAAVALRDAQARIRKEDPSLDWSAFRVVSR